MRTVVTILMAAITIISAIASSYTYTFRNTPISEAIVRISKDHPEINISFIYKELDNYRTSARIHTDDAYDALRHAIGLNPISVIKDGDHYYIEAFQHGKFSYSGRAVSSNGEPVTAATVMLIAPKDSTVITYGITDRSGRFVIPCDRQGVIAKLTCIGYKPTYRNCDAFILGDIIMDELPIRLKNVNVEADNASLLSDKSVYRPTPRQKNASQTAVDLLVRMAIPQLNARLGSSTVSTASGQPVAIYIDYVPASEQDLKMMRTADVRSVEYYDYPVDSRFQGNRHVINFIMAKYEYGGYVKTLATENFIANSGFLQANARFVKKRMTYDLMGYGYYMSNNHFGIDQTEVFRLPQENGDLKSFSRESLTESSKLRKRNYETSFRALYSGDNVTANNQIAFGMENTPHNDNSGLVRYSDASTIQSDYTSMSDSKAKYLNYSGYYYFGLRNNNSLTLSARYSYSHTDQSSDYLENFMSSIYNAAKDDTHSGNMYLSYNQSFSDNHSIIAHLRGIYEHNRTHYSGSVNALDNSVTLDGQAGAAYSYSNTKVSASAGFGWDWMSTKLNDNKAFSNFPYIDASFRYVPDKTNSFGAVFHYSVWPPSSNYKSENIIHISPFLWHTGNPMLKSHRSYDIGIDYTFIPSNKFNMTVYGSAWLVGNRAAFMYEATADRVIRTIQQPIGSFGHYNYGVNASTKQLDGNLHLSAQLSQLLVHNGVPYNTTHSCISYYLQALYYLGNFNFAIAYQSADATDNYDSMSGRWTKNKDRFIIQAGWSNSSWNVVITAQNLQRWNWRASRDTMHSQHYSVNKYISNTSRHAFVQLSATYTFGFGKKVKQGNDISRQAGASSGILK